MPQFYSHGKFLISGEYLVLQGALALAVPTKPGQKMKAEEDPGGEHNLRWINTDAQGKISDEVLLSKKDFQPYRGSLQTVDAAVYETLAKCLIYCRKKNPAFLKTPGSTQVVNTLEFNREWGLGSSSTFLNNLAQFARVDAFEMQKEIFGGSGYDIACAKSSMPVFYRVDEEGPVYDSVHFSPPEAEQIFFVYLNQKQNSSAEVKNFTTQDIKFAPETEIISEISEALLFCDDFADFMQLLDEHEDVMQFVLQKEKIKTERFADFQGVVKSLGAWGGDFILAASEMPSTDLKKYFNAKGFNTIFNYKEIIL